MTVQELREKAHDSQTDLANYLGISDSALSKKENAQRKFLPKELAKICAKYHVRVENITGLKT